MAVRGIGRLRSAPAAAQTEGGARRAGPERFFHWTAPSTSRVKLLQRRAEPACADRAADQCGAFCLGCAPTGSCGNGLVCANGCHCPQTCLGYNPASGSCVGAPSNACSPPLDNSGIPCTP